MYYDAHTLIKKNCSILRRNNNCFYMFFSRYHILQNVGNTDETANDKVNK